MWELMSGSWDSGLVCPPCRRARRNEVTGEKYNPDEQLDDNISIYPKTEQQQSDIKQQLSTLTMLRSLDSTVINTITDAMMPLEVEAGAVVLTEGDTTTDKFYIVEIGVFQGSITKPCGEVEVSKVYENSGHFGGVSIFHYYPSSLTVQALTKGNLWVLDRYTYQKIVANFASQRRQVYKTFIDKIPSLSGLSQCQKLDLADAFISLNFNDGDIIIKKDEPAQGIYFIEFGSVKCASENLVLSEGDYFNEHALSSSDPVTNYDMHSVGATKLGFLALSSFNRLQGSCAHSNIEFVTDIH